MIECEPTSKDEIEIVATPPLNEPVPRIVAPSLKVIVPEGSPTPGAIGATVAEMMIDWPKTLGLFDDETTVVVLATLTVWVIKDALLGALLESPLYTAVIACDPTINEVVVNVAMLEPLRD